MILLNYYYAKITASEECTEIEMLLPSITIPYCLALRF